MNEPPGARARVGLTGLTVAEYFRDQGQDVLFFVDNIFRFTQAGSEVSALLGRIPSAVGYQPTLATDMGALQERITTTTQGLDHLGAGDLRAGRRLDRPGAGDLVRPSGRHHGAEPRDLGKGHLSGGRSARLDLAHAVAAASSARSTTRPRAWCSRCCRSYKSLQDIIAILGMDELSEEDKIDGGARAQDRALPVAAVPRRRSLHRLARQVRRPRRHHQGLPAAICEGKYDHLPEAAFYMVGTIEEAVEKGKKLAAEAA